MTPKILIVGGAEVASTPQITIVAANSSVSLQGNFTLVMADADVVGTNESAGQTRHWLVNGVTLTGTARFALGKAECSLLVLTNLLLLPQVLIPR